MRQIILPLAIVFACVSSVSAQSTVSFDNQSGEPAFVKLVGPTPSEVEVPNGTKQGVQASAGRYFIKVRYGTAAKYHYAKGEEFEVKETATTRSKITITLHKVVAGNYESQPISETEFGTASAVLSRSQSPPPAKPEGSGSSVVRRAEQQQGGVLDDTDFARLTAGLFLASGIKPDAVNAALWIASPKVADNEVSRALLKKYNITVEQFKQEYQYRMFDKDNAFNRILWAKVHAEMKRMADAMPSTPIFR